MIEEIIFDESKTGIHKIDENQYQFDVSACFVHDQTKSKSRHQVDVYINNQLLKTLEVDRKGNINGSFLIEDITEDISLKLVHQLSGAKSNLKISSKDFICENKHIKIAIASVKMDPKSFLKLSETYRNDKEIVRIVIGQDCSLLKGASDKIKSDKDFLKDLIIKYPEMLKYVGESLKEDKEFVLRAIEQKLDVFKYASILIQTDKDFVIECFTRFGLNIFHHLSKYMQQELYSFLVYEKKNIFGIRRNI